MRVAPKIERTDDHALSWDDFDLYNESPQLVGYLTDHVRISCGHASVIRKIVYIYFCDQLNQATFVGFDERNSFIWILSHLPKSDVSTHDVACSIARPRIMSIAHRQLSSCCPAASRHAVPHESTDDSIGRGHWYPVCILATVSMDWKPRHGTLYLVGCSNAFPRRTMAGTSFADSHGFTHESFSVQNQGFPRGSCARCISTFTYTYAHVVGVLFSIMGWKRVDGEHDLLGAA